MHTGACVCAVTPSIQTNAFAMSHVDCATFWAGGASKVSQLIIFCGVPRRIFGSCPLDIFIIYCYGFFRISWSVRTIRQCVCSSRFLALFVCSSIDGREFQSNWVAHKEILNFGSDNNPTQLFSHSTKCELYVNRIRDSKSDMANNLRPKSGRGVGRQRPHIRMRMWNTKPKRSYAVLVSSADRPQAITHQMI